MLKKAENQTLCEKNIEMLASRFRTLGDASRLRLIVAASNGEKNVSQLVTATGLNQSNVSGHLQTLTAAGFLVRRREGVQVFYSTADATVYDLCKVLGKSLKKQLNSQAEIFGVRV